MKTGFKVELQDIQSARQRLQPFIRQTEMDVSLSASKRLGSEVHFKYENEQLTGSFKIRGALNKIMNLSAEEKSRGVVASSAGNHAQGVALSASKLNTRSTIVMPVNAPIIKVEATREYGAEVVLHGEIYDDAYEKALELEKLKNFIFVHPFQDPHVIAGQGTLGLEMIEKCPDLDSVVVPIGGGGLISGIALAIKSVRPQCRVIGVQSTQTPGMSQLFRGEKPSDQGRITTIADGIAVKRPSEFMYQQFISKLVDEIVTVSDDEIAEAIVFLMERSKSVVEGSGAAGLAAAFNRNLNLGKKTAILLCGGNIDLNMAAKIIEKGQIKKGRLIELSVVVPDLPGSLHRLTQVLAEKRANVLEVHHDRVFKGLYLRETRIDFVLETRDQNHIEEIRQALAATGARWIS